MNALKRIATRLRPESGSKVSLGPIGVDLALNRMHVVQLSSSEDKFSLKAQTSVAYPTSRDDVLESLTPLTALTRSALRAAPFSGRHAVVALPAGAFRTMSVAYQVTPGQSEARIITGLMRDRLDGDLSDYVLDFVPVRKSGRAAERIALVAASPRKLVTGFLDALRRGGLEVDALEIGPLSIRRLINALPDMSPQDNVVVVNTGLDTTYVTVLAGRRLLSDQDFRFGEDTLVQRLADSLDMSAEAARNLVKRTGLEPLSRGDQVSVALNESGIFNTLLEIIRPDLMRLVAEIERAVLFTSSETHGGKVSRIYLVGALTRWRGVASALHNILGLHVTNLSAPLSSFTSEVGIEPNSDMAVATGLALRGLVDDG